MSFRLKTILGIALIELSVMVVLIFMNQLNFGGTASSELYDRGRVTARLFSNMVTDAVISTDLATIDSMIANTLHNDELIYLRVLDSAGNLLSQGGHAAAMAQPFFEDATFDSALSDSRIDVTEAIRIGDQDFGRIELGLSTLRVEQGIRWALRWNVFVAIVGMTLVAVFGFLLGSVLTRQLSSLRDGARMIEEGNLAHRVPVRGGDELAVTAKCFNRMAAALAADRDALQTQQVDLLEKRDRVLEIVAIMREIVGGKTLVAVPSQSRVDEIGEMARATAIFRNTMEENVAARQEQSRLIDAFNRLGEQVAIFDANERVIFANAAFRSANHPVFTSLQITYSYDEFLRTGIAMNSFSDAGDDADSWIRIFRREASDEGGAAELVRSDGCRLLVRETDVEGVGIIVIATDITELRLSQAQVVHTSKLATLGEMAAGLAHELNQPLGVIRMAAGNMLRRIDKGTLESEYAAGKLKRIAGQTERAATIIDHMRIFARKDDQRVEPFDLAEAVRDATTMMRAQLSGSNIQIIEEFSVKTVPSTGSKVMFEQVVVNLLANARDAILHRANEGEERADRKISVSLLIEDTETVVTISDTGGGIPEEVRARLFEPFFTTKAPGKGTGLGLSISYGIIRDMGGEITAANTGDGCAFTVKVPLAA